MDTLFSEFSLVILASDHNPTILNPDFLARNQIVSDDWGWRVIGQPITTPAFATVQYDSKVAVTVEPMKLQVTDTSGSMIEENHLVQIVSKYVELLPHVEYSALGINFTTLKIVDNSRNFLIGRYLKDGNWNSEENRMLGVGYKFPYKLENGHIIFSVDEGGREGIDKPLIVCRANFHRALDATRMPTSDQIIDNLGRIDNDLKRYNQLFKAIIED